LLPYRFCSGARESLLFCLFLSPALMLPDLSFFLEKALPIRLQARMY
jgi:hypothetical protein